MFLPLEVTLERIVKTGQLEFVDSAGKKKGFGDGSGPAITVRLADKAVERELVRDPEAAAGDAYIQGRLSMAEGSVYDFLALIMRNMAANSLPQWTQTFAALRRWIRPLLEFNPCERARRNVEHHYDIDPRIYDLFLDSDRHYSCAYFLPGADLEAAQRAKVRHIAGKLRLDAGSRVLDVGSGWGGLALSLAQTAGTEVTGITLSPSQVAVAERRAREAGLDGRVRFALQDYRDVEGAFDRIVSVGMFEHVGRPHYSAYFRCLAGLLHDDGVGLLHTIGRSDTPAPTNPFIARHVFPGGALPTLSEIMTAIEKSGLIVTDIEVLRLHYAETLKAWRHRFLARRDEAVAIAGEGFARMWEFYLAGSEAAFRFQGLVVFQIQFAKRVDSLPITRDYMLDNERRLAALDRTPAEWPGLAGE